MIFVFLLNTMKLTIVWASLLLIKSRIPKNLLRMRPMKPFSPVKKRSLKTLNQPDVNAKVASVSDYTVLVSKLMEGVDQTASVWTVSILMIIKM